MVARKVGRKRLVSASFERRICLTGLVQKTVGVGCNALRVAIKAYRGSRL